MDKCYHKNFIHYKKNIFLCFDCDTTFKLNVKKCDSEECNRYEPPLKLFKFNNLNLCENCFKKKQEER